MYKHTHAEQLHCSADVYFFKKPKDTPQEAMGDPDEVDIAGLCKTDHRSGNWFVFDFLVFTGIPLLF